MKQSFQSAFEEKIVVDPSPSTDVEEIWSKLKNNLLSTTNEVCGLTKKSHIKRTTWWWDDDVDRLITEKRKLWKAWKAGGSKEPYLAAKRAAKKGVFEAKRAADEEYFSNLKRQWCISCSEADASN